MSAAVLNEKTADIVVSFLEKYIRHFEELADFLAKKQNKILLDDLNWLEEALVQEQGFIMKGNSLEDKRSELFEQIGLSGKKFSELPQFFPEDYHGVLGLQNDRLNKSIERIKQINAVSKDIVERKLEYQKKLLGVNEFTGIGAYSEDAQIVKGGGGSGDIIGNV